MSQTAVPCCIFQSCAQRFRSKRCSFVAQHVELLPHSSSDLDSILTFGAVSVESTCSLCHCMGFLQVLHFSSTSQMWVDRLVDCYKLPLGCRWVVEIRRMWWEYFGGIIKVNINRRLKIGVDLVSSRAFFHAQWFYNRLLVWGKGPVSTFDSRCPAWKKVYIPWPQKIN